MSEEIDTTLGEQPAEEEIQDPEQKGEEEPETPSGEGEQQDEDSSVEGLKQAAIAERKKRQAVEAELEQLKQQQKPEPIQPSNQQETIEDMFVRDPRGTTEMINAEIAKLVEDDPYGNAVQIERLRDLKADLRDTGKAKASEKVNTFAAEVNKAIPDFAAKRDALTKYAVEQLGYTVEDLAKVTNFQIVGEKAALNTIRLINQQYDLVSGKTPVKKVTQAPEPLTPLSGSKSTPPNAEPDPEKDPDAWLAWERARKRKEGKLY